MKKKFLLFVITLLAALMIGYVITVRAAKPPVPPEQALRDTLTAIENGNTVEADTYLGKDNLLEEEPGGGKAALKPSIKANSFSSFKVDKIIEGEHGGKKATVVQGEFTLEGPGTPEPVTLNTLFVNTRKDKDGYWKIYISTGP